MGFMFCDLHVSLKYPFVGGYKFVQFVLLVISMLECLVANTFLYCMVYSPY